MHSNIDFINENWQEFNDKISDLFFPYEDKNIFKFPTVKELIPLLNEDDTINFCINTHSDYTCYPPKLFKQDILKICHKAKQVKSLACTKWKFHAKKKRSYQN